MKHAAVALLLLLSLCAASGISIDEFEMTINSLTGQANAATKTIANVNTFDASSLSQGQVIPQSVGALYGQFIQLLTTIGQEGKPAPFDTDADAATAEAANQALTAVLTNMANVIQGKSSALIIPFYPVYEASLNALSAVYDTYALLLADMCPTRAADIMAAQAMVAEALDAAAKAYTF